MMCVMEQTRWFELRIERWRRQRPGQRRRCYSWLDDAASCRLAVVYSQLLVGWVWDVLWKTIDKYIRDFEFKMVALAVAVVKERGLIWWGKRTSASWIVEGLSAWVGWSDVSMSEKDGQTNLSPLSFKISIVLEYQRFIIVCIAMNII